MDMARAVSIGLFVLAATVACAQTFEHTDIGAQLTKIEYEAEDAHVIVDGSGGELLYGATTGTLNVLDAGAAGYILRVSDGTPYPEWTSATLAVTPVPTPTPMPTATPVAHALLTTLTVGNGATSYTLPGEDGTASQTLITSGTGVVRWVGWPTPMPTTTPIPDVWVVDDGSQTISIATPTATGTPQPYDIKLDRYAGVNAYDGDNAFRLGVSGGSVYLGAVATPAFSSTATGTGWRDYGGVTIGEGAITAGTDGIVIGPNAGDGDEHDQVVWLGAGAGNACARSSNSVYLGSYAGRYQDDGEYKGPSVAVGYHALGASGTLRSRDESTVVGAYSGYNSTGDRLSILGHEAGRSGTGDDLIAIGWQAGYENGYSDVLAVGKAASATGANQAVFGGEQVPYHTVYFGKGAESTAPTDYTISGTDASAGSNADGGDVILSGGDGDGAGSAGGVQVSGDLTVSGSISPWPTPVVDPSETPASGDLLVYMPPYFTPAEPGAAVTPVPIDWAGSPSDGEVLAWSVGDGEYAPVGSLSLASVAAGTVDVSGQYTSSDDYLLGRISATTHLSGPVDIHGGVDPTATPVVGIDATGNVTARGGLTANASNGDNDLYYGKQTSGVLLFGDASEGYLGVNNDSPGAELDVTGDAEISGDLDVGSTALTVTQSTGDVTVGNDLDVGGALDVTGDAAFDTDTLFVDESTDRVGVNTSTPSAALDVVGDAEVSGAATFDGAITSTADVVLGTDVDPNAVFLDADVGDIVINGDGTTHTKFRIEGVTEQSLFVTDPADDEVYTYGEFGIKNSNPAYGLDVNGTAHIVGAATLDSTLDVTGAATFDSIITITGSADAELALQTSSDDAILTMDATDDSWISFQVGGADRWWIIANEGSSELYVRDTENGANPFRIDAACANNLLCLDSADRVGIGTASPSCELDVEGEIECTALTETSDAAFKRDITPVAPGGLDVLRSVTPKTWRWNDDPTTASKKTGFVAQDLQTACPEAVVERTRHIPQERVWDDDTQTTLTLPARTETHLAVRPTALTATLWRALREEVAAREAIETTVAAQAAALAALEARVEALETARAEVAR